MLRRGTRRGFRVECGEVRVGGGLKVVEKRRFENTKELEFGFDRISF